VGIENTNGWNFHGFKGNGGAKVKALKSSDRERKGILAGTEQFGAGAG
jgi:hypothetical protein